MTCSSHSSPLSPEHKFSPSDSFYHQLFNETNVIKLIIDLDTLQILEANPTACKFYGYSAAQMTSMQLSAINTRPESEIRATAQKIVVGTISTFQTQHRLASGRICDVEIQAGLIDQVDKRYLYEVIQDVTERKRLEDQLRASEERLRNTIYYAPIGMALFTLDGYWLDVNPAICQILGYSSEELLQKWFKDVTHPDDLELDRQHVQDLLAGKIDLYRMEKRYFHKQGHVIWALLSVSLVRDKSGAPICFICQIQDISELKQMENMLLEKQKLQTSLEKEQELSQLKTRMMERIAHEFRTPLSVIQSTAETLIRYYDRLTPEKRETKGDVIKDQINHITSMLDAISQVVRNTDGRQLEPQRTDLGIMCREIAAELTTALNLSGKYIIEAQGNLLASIDPIVIHDSLAHIMRNAAYYSEPADPVKVRIDQIGDSIELRIIDHGIGIAQNELPRIFEPFYRGSNINERGGLGVGLTIARATIEAHGGTIRAESELNKGTVVIVTLPI